MSARRQSLHTHTVNTPVTLSEYAGVRSLHLGTEWIQGSMRISNPLVVELEYVQKMLASMLWLPTERLRLGRAVQLGLGAGAITRFTHRSLGVATVAVELNPKVIMACRAVFDLGDDDARLQVVQADAGHWVADPCHHGTAQLLHVDLYDHDAAAPVLDTPEFYTHCRSVLVDGGVMAVNLFGRDARFERSIGHIAQAFGTDQVWSIKPTAEGNAVVVAGRKVVVPDAQALRARALHLQQCFGAIKLKATTWLNMVRPYQPA